MNKFRGEDHLIKSEIRNLYFFSLRTSGVSIVAGTRTRAHIELSGIYPCYIFSKNREMEAIERKEIIMIGGRDTENLYRLR